MTARALRHVAAKHPCAATGLVLLAQGRADPRFGPEARQGWQMEPCGCGACQAHGKASPHHEAAKNDHALSSKWGKSNYVAAAHAKGRIRQAPTARRPPLIWPSAVRISSTVIVPLLSASMLRKSCCSPARTQHGLAVNVRSCPACRWDECECPGPDAGHLLKGCAHCKYPRVSSSGKASFHVSAISNGLCGAYLECQLPSQERPHSVGHIWGGYSTAMSALKKKIKQEVLRAASKHGQT